MTESGVVLASLVAVHLLAGHTELGPLLVLQLHGVADWAGGGQHLVPLQQVITHHLARDVYY